LHANTSANLQCWRTPLTTWTHDATISNDRSPFALYTPPPIRLDPMLHILPAEVTLNVLSHLPITSLLSLLVLSRQWSHFFATHQSAIFYSAAIHHEYIQPGTSLEDALSVNTGRPWAGSKSWKDFCKSYLCHFHLYLFTRCPPLTAHSHREGCRSLQLSKNWEGKGCAVTRVISLDSNTHCIKVDEKAGICVVTHQWGGLTVTHLISCATLWCLTRVRECTCCPL
jgi:hypothetical protein